VQCLLAVAAAHFVRRLQAGAAGGALWLTEQGATQVGLQLHTGQVGRFAFWQTGDGAADGWGDAARGASRAAVHA